jgi:hypothetical protein
VRELVQALDGRRGFGHLGVKIIVIVGDVSAVLMRVVGVDDRRGSWVSITEGRGVWMTERRSVKGRQAAYLPAKTQVVTLVDEAP